MASPDRVLEQLTSYLEARERVELLELAETLTAASRSRTELQATYGKLAAGKQLLRHQAGEPRSSSSLQQTSAYLAALKLDFLSKSDRWQEVTRQALSKEQSFKQLRARLEALRLARKHMQHQARQGLLRIQQKQLDEFAARGRRRQTGMGHFCTF